MKCSLFLELTDQEQRFFSKKDFSKGAIIFNEGDSCNSLGIIDSGSITVSTLTYFDQEYNIASLKEGDIFGENLLFPGKKYLGDIIAKEDTSIFFIKRDDLIMLLKNENFLIKYLSILANKHILTLEKLKILSQKSVLDKIMYYISSCIKKTHNNTIFINSKEELASLLNIPRPSLSRGLIILKRKGQIDYNKHYIIKK